MFEEYAKKLEELGENVPKVFNTVAKKGAIHARNTAIEITNREGLVDTGAYRRNWNGESGKTKNDTYAITLENSMEYASHLEYGHKLRGINENRKYKIKRPWNIDVPNVRYKGFFVGARTLVDTEGYTLNLLFEEIINLLILFILIPLALESS